MLTQKSASLSPGKMNIDNSLLEKYFKGNCTPAEVKIVEAYLDQQDTPATDE